MYSFWTRISTAGKCPKWVHREQNENYIEKDDRFNRYLAKATVHLQSQNLQFNSVAFNTWEIIISAVDQICLHKSPAQSAS